MDVADLHDPERFRLPPHSASAHTMRAWAAYFFLGAPRPHANCLARLQGDTYNGEPADLPDQARTNMRRAARKLLEFDRWQQHRHAHIHDAVDKRRAARHLLRNRAALSRSYAVPCQRPA